MDIEDPKQLEEYLRQTGRVGPGEQLDIRVLAGGVSCRTVLVQLSSGPCWVVKQALAKLRVAVDWFSDPARVEREATGMRWLEKLAPPGSITPLVFEDPGQFLLAMQAVPQPHDNFKSLLLAGRVESSHVRQFGALAGTIHRRAWERRSELAAVFDERAHYRALRLEAYYQYSAGQVPEAAEFMHALVRSTEERRLTLVHGDYSPKNVLVHQGRLILLDHEVIHWGDPTFDLGFSMTHFLSKAHHLPAHRRRFVEAVGEYWDAYREALGAVPWDDDLEIHAVRQTLGCLLARVAGRSPLEYLGPEERRRQRQAVVKLMAAPPRRVRELAGRFVELVGT